MNHSHRYFLVAVALATAALAQNPLAAQEGVFRGSVQPTPAVPQIPPGGLPLEITLLRNGAAGLSGRLSLKGSSSGLKDVRRNEDGGYSAQTQLMGMPTEVRFTLNGDELAGELRAPAFSIPFQARRGAAPAGPAATRTSLAPLAELRAEDWLADLAFLERELPARHAAWFAGLTKEQWRAAVAGARAAIPKARLEAVVARLAQLVAMRGDSHTVLYMQEAPQFAPAPVRFERFPDGVYVVAAPAAHQDRIGGRVTAVAATPIADVLARLATVHAAENEQWRRGDAYLLCRPGLLCGLGLTESADALELTVAKGGNSQRFTVRRGDGPIVRAPVGTDPPLWRRLASRSYAFGFTAQGDTLFLSFDSCLDDPKRPFVQVAAQLVDAIAERKPQRLFLDLRRNGGGSTMVLEPLIEWLAGHPVLDHPSRLFVATGMRTFSSAMLHAIDFRARTRATLIGEPTGGKPNACGEVRRMRLPRSGLLVGYSTQHFRTVAGDPPSVAPDRLVACSAADYFAGRDPVLAAACAQQPAGRSWSDAALPAGIEAVWSGALRGGAGPRGGITFMLAVAKNAQGELEAAIETLLRPVPLTGLSFDAESSQLAGTVTLPRFGTPIRLQFTLRGQTLAVTTPDAPLRGHALRASSRDPRPAILHAQFEAAATDAAATSRATALGHRLVGAWRDDAARLHSLAYRLLTEDHFGRRLDAVARAAAQRALELVEDPEQRAAIERLLPRSGATRRK